MDPLKGEKFKDKNFFLDVKSYIFTTYGKSVMFTG